MRYLKNTNRKNDPWSVSSEWLQWGLPGRHTFCMFEMECTTACTLEPISGSAGRSSADCVKWSTAGQLATPNMTHTDSLSCYGQQPLGSALRTSSTCTLLLCNLSTSIWTRTLPVTRTLKLYLICRCEISAASIPRALVKSQTTYLRYIVCRKWRKICEIAATQEMSKMSWVQSTWKIADKLLY